MQSINSQEQKQAIEADVSLPLIVAVLGNSEVLAQISPERIKREVECGVWDEALNDPGFGLQSRSLLLCLMGTQPDLMSRNNASQFGVTVDIGPLAHAMVARGASPLWKDKDGRDCLDQAFACAALDLLKAWSSGLSAEDLGRRTHTSNLPWIHKACHKANLGMVEFLLDRGLDVNQTNTNRETPLFWASSAEVVQLLLSRGADPEHRNDDGMDARVFWSQLKGLTQSEQVAMASQLPKLSKKTSRQTRVFDFYVLAHTAGKSLLVKEMKSLRLLPEELDSRGFGLIGNLGQRLLDPRSNVDGVVGMKTSNWVDTVAGMPEFVAAASEKDWISLWVGASRFNDLKSLQEKFHILSLPIAKDPQFWVKCIEKAHEIAPALQYKNGVCMLKNAAQALPSIMEFLEQEGFISGDVARWHVRTHLAIVDKKYPLENRMAVREQQNALLGLMRRHPSWKLHETEEAWHLALTLDRPGYSVENKNLFSPELAKFLLERGAPIPASALALAQSQMSEANSATVEALSTFQVGVLQQNTHQSNQVPRRGSRL